MHIPDLDLRLLTTLDLLLRLRSVSRTAKALGCTQPSVSHALKRLRAVFDDELFIRTPSGMEPTPRALTAGVALGEVLDRIRGDLLAPPHFDPARITRLVTLQMTDVGQVVFVPRLLAALAERAPGVDVRVVSQPTQGVGSLLRSGAVDLVIGRYPESEEAGVYRQRLFSHSFTCVVPRDYAGRGARISRRRYEQARHVTVEGESMTDAIVEAALAAEGISRRIVLSLPHYLAIPSVVVENHLVATVPVAVGMAFARLASVRVLRPPVELPRLDVHQWWHARLHEDHFSRWLRELVAELFRADTRARPGAPLR